MRNAITILIALTLIQCKPIYDCANRCIRTYVGYEDAYTGKVHLAPAIVSLNEEWVSNPLDTSSYFLTRQVAYNQFEVLNHPRFKLIEFTSTQYKIYERINGKLMLAYTFYE